MNLIKYVNILLVFMLVSCNKNQPEKHIGIIIDFEKKGYLNKTWEGRFLTNDNVTFQFSAEDNKIELLKLIQYSFKNNLKVKIITYKSERKAIVNNFYTSDIIDSLYLLENK